MNSGEKPLKDQHAQRELVSHCHVWSGKVFGLDEDQVRLSAGAAPVVRQYLHHGGAVAIVAMRGEAGVEEVLLERQYRHPVRAELWEIPAGLLDVPGEDPLRAAQRELREEADLIAHQWDVLVDAFSSPGASCESVRLFLARDVESCDQPFERQDEEADLEYQWVNLDLVYQWIMAGWLHNPSTVMGCLAAWSARATGFSTLRDAGAPWWR